MRFARLLALLLAGAARAAPNLPFGHPDWTLLRDAQARGLLADPVGGQQALGEDEVQRALVALRLPPDRRLLTLEEAGFWIRPVETATLRAVALHEHDRPYSLELRPRHLAGEVGTSCELQEGRPCGGGLGLMPEVDSAAGWGSWLSASTRLRLDLGNNRYAPEVALDRAYLKAQLGFLAVEAGRDLLALGPSARAALLVSRNPAPLDQLRAWTRPLPLPFFDARVTFLYFIARLRDPQFYPGTLVDCTRVQLDLFNHLQLGGSRLLQFGGTGAPAIGLGSFISQHFQRDYDSKGAPLGDNRLALDAAVSVPALGGARFYTEVSFEDFRKQELNVFQYDADYLLGAEFRALDAGPLRRILIEVAKTGRISQEGIYWLTGWTNAGRALGSPLGPDGLSIYARAELELPAARLSPWVEWLRFSSDTFKDDGQGGGGVAVDKVGPIESRRRAGLDLSVPLTRAFLLEANLYVELVTTAELVPDATRHNGGAVVRLRYFPEF